MTLIVYFSLLSKGNMNLYGRVVYIYAKKYILFNML